jgi:transcription initiation factor TFIID subunit 1
MRVSVKEIAKQFNYAISEKDIRRRIRRKIVVPVRDPKLRKKVGEDDDEDEFELNPDYRFADDLMIHRMCPVEDVCAYESMRAAKAGAYTHSLFSSI